MNDPLKPSASILVKLSSLVVHIEEFFSPDGHEFDKAAINTLLGDSELCAWLKQMGKMGFLPVKRN